MMADADNPLIITPAALAPRPPAARPAPGSRSPLTHLPPIQRCATPNHDGHSSPPRSPRSPRSPAPPHSPLPPGRPWSRYHHGCVARSTAFLDWTARKVLKKKTGDGKARGLKGSTESIKDEEEVAAFLDRRHGFLEAYVLQRVPCRELERWLLRKTRIQPVEPTANGRNKTKDKAKSSQNSTFMEQLSELQECSSEYALVRRLAGCVGAAAGGDVRRVYQLRQDQPAVHYFVHDDQGGGSAGDQISLSAAEPEAAALVRDVARGGRPVAVAPNRAKGAQEECQHVVYQPLQVSGACYVVQLARARRFQHAELQRAGAAALWGALALHYRLLTAHYTNERNMADFLLDVVKAIFEEMVSLEQLIKRILEFAQRLVSADRASLFLVDARHRELVSTVFDLRFERVPPRAPRNEIRMPINRGIAGHVALSGETMNIPDAYADYRFNRDVDEATGYKTVSILCMPIKVEGKVIGVVQMVNKRTERTFGREDEAAFEIFSTFFGLALHHARLYDRILRKEQKYRVALEVLSYHNTCGEPEVRALLADPNVSNVDLDDFYLDPYQLSEQEKCQCALRMFHTLFDASAFETETLARFVLTVRKNYRRVPYHNFQHGWAVAHAMYVMLRTDGCQRYSYNMRLALFVASLCHDLDHRGYTNKYMSETASPLAAMYTTSTLEHHHFNITVTILQQDGHNIFSHMSGEEYKEVLGFIRQAILATDLAAFFPNLERMKELLRDNAAFHWDNHAHRDLAMAISMTAADLSASAKPWRVQLRTVRVIFEEFYAQGDQEAAAGRAPIPMMDRTKTDEQPASQVGFLSQICIPCYTVLCKVLPNTKPMYVMAMKNLRRWKARADRIARKAQGNELKETEESGDSEVEEDIVDEEEILVVEEKATAVETKVEEIVENLTTIDDNPIEPVEALEVDPMWEKDVEEKRVNKEFWKNTDEAWVDDEGVVVKGSGIEK